MNARRRDDGESRVELARLFNGRLSVGWGAVAILGVGLVLSVLGSLLLTGGIVAAAPCTDCGRALDPVQYTSLAERAAAEGAVGTSPGLGPEFFVGRSGLEVATEVEEARSFASPLAGPEFWLRRSVDDMSKCVTWSEALDRFHAFKRIDDPANGALSLTQADFYVNYFGAGEGSFIVTLADGLDKVLCEA